MINFEDGVMITPPKVIIDGVEHEVIPAVYEGKTPFSARNINRMQEEIGTIVSPTEPTGDNREKVWIQKGKNILIPSNGSTAISNNDNNTYTFKSDLAINWYNCIATAKLKANTQYTISVSSNLLYGRLALSSIPEGTPDGYPADIDGNALNILTPTNNSTTFISNKEQTVYLRYCSDYERTNLSSFTASIQLEQGSIATEYEPYVEKKIFVKNDNGVYEEFINADKIDRNAEEIKILNGTVIYNNSSGSAGDIEFLKSIANCKYIDVVYSAWGGFSTKRFYEPVGKSCFIDGMVFSNDNSSYNFVHSYSISDTGMTRKTYSGAFLRDYTTGNISGLPGGNNNVKIHKVICYY